MAAVTQEDEQVRWQEAKPIVLDSYSAFSDELGGIVRRFFDERWIDAPPRPGKRGGAFCSFGVPSVHPYVLLNYTHRRRDVLDARPRARPRRARGARRRRRASSTWARR